jgi:SAM-dependent methyltransferase
MIDTRSTASAFAWACPACRRGIDAHERQATCGACGAIYPRRDGIWHFLSPEQAAAFEQFEREYLTVRRGEGWGSEQPEYYRALPWQDLSGQFVGLWRIRAQSFLTLLQNIVVPREGPRPLTVLDLGAGNGWLAYRLAQRGHHVAAVDILTDARDGLGAWHAYDAAFTPVQAAFDDLPLADHQADLAVFNGSLHYSADYVRSLREALRVLRRDGLIVVLDSPWYGDPRSGAGMVREREARFRRAYGFTSSGIDSEHFLTPSRLNALNSALQIRWRVLWPRRGWAWLLRPWLARARGHREPARFPVIVGSVA